MRVERHTKTDKRHREKELVSTLEALAALEGCHVSVWWRCQRSLLLHPALGSFAACVNPNT